MNNFFLHLFLPLTNLNKYTPTRFAIKKIILPGEFNVD